MEHGQHADACARKGLHVAGALAHSGSVESIAQPMYGQQFAHVFAGARSHLQTSLGMPCAPHVAEQCVATKLAPADWKLAIGTKLGTSEMCLMQASCGVRVV